MPTSVSAPIIAIDYPRSLLSYMQQQGFDSAQVLRQAKISSELIADKQAFLTVEQYRRLLNLAQQQLNDPVLGLRLGIAQHVGAHGPLGYAIMSSKNLDQAMKKVCRYIRTRNNLTRVSYFSEAEQIVIRLDVQLELDDLYRFVVEQSFASFMNIFQSLFGHANAKVQVALKYAAPQQTQYYQTIFGHTAKFEQQDNEIHIDKRFLQQLSLGDDAVVAQMAEQQCQTIMKTLNSNDIVASVQTILQQSANLYPTQADVAKQLGLSNRSLVRQLTQRQSSFSNLLQQHKYDLAKLHLRQRQFKIEDIAYLLGYENPANFSRSFKKWSGTSPSAYRQRNQDKTNQ